MMKFTELFEKSDQKVVAEFEAILKNLEIENGFEIDTIRLSKHKLNCRFVRKVYRRNGQRYVKYERVCD